MSAIQNSRHDPNLLLVEGARKSPASITLRSSPGKSRLVFASARGSVAAEQYRVIRRKLAEKYQNGGIILVSSPGPGDGKTLTSLNLAWCIAETGATTLLAELDLRNPSLTGLLNFAAGSAGMEAVLANALDPEPFLRQVNRMPLHVAAVAKISSDPVELLAGDNMTRFLDWARTRYKWVLLDAPPLFPLADSLEISSRADSTLLVVRAGATPKALVQKSVELLGPRLQFVILNGADERADSSYNYLSAYYPYGDGSRKRSPIFKK